MQRAAWQMWRGFFGLLVLCFFFFLSEVTVRQVHVFLFHIISVLIPEDTELSL